MSGRLFACAGLLGLVLWGGAQFPARAAEPDHPARPGPADIIIKRIDIHGLHKIAETTVRSKLPLREGDRFTVDGVRKAVSEVHRLGYFEDVQAATEGFEGGLKLIVTVKEWPVVRDLRYEGYDQVSLDKLKERVTIQTGNFLDLRALTGATRSLATYYHDQGYFQARVVPLLQELRPGDVAVTFVIQEGGRARVRSVEFTGNRAAGARQLRKTVETKSYFWLTSWLTDSGLYQEEQAAQDVERVRDYYLDRGYLQVQVGKPRVSLSEDQRWFDVVFPIVEGDPYTISAVTFTGLKLFPEERVRAMMTTTPGTLFRRSQIRADILAVTDLYGEQGYAFAQVAPDVKPDPAAKQAAIVFQVQEGEQIRVRRIDIAGNLKTRDKVIRRELRVAEQEILNTKALKRSFERLNNLNFFESVEIAPATRPPNEVDLEVRVKEKPTGTFSIGGGYSSVDRFVGLVEITQGNLFGRGQLLRVQAQLGGRSSSYSLTFRDPYFLDYPVSASLSVFNQRRDFDTYTEQRKGGGLVFGKNFTEYVSGSVGYSLQKLEIFDVAVSAPPLIQEQTGTSTTSSLRFALSRDSRDFYLAPTRGSRHSLTIDVAGTVLGGSNHFYKVTADSVVFFPVWWETVFSARARLGVASFIKSNGTLPVGERFFVGGIDSVRGFDFGEAGPTVFGEVIGGNKQLIFNLEYLFPIVPEAKIRGVLFFDAGRAFDFGESIRLSELRTSVGLGLRLYLPIGPIRIEWGYSLSPQPGEKGNAVEFTIGAPF